MRWSGLTAVMPHMDNALAVGTVWHRRRTPRDHRFKYRLYYSLIDIERIDDLCRRSRWWSLERFNLVCFRRSDYLGDAGQTLPEAVRERVRASSGVRPAGRILLLTHLRQWGVCFNPVSFYLCFGVEDQLDFIVAEVHNTPWNERHAYVLDCRQQSGPAYRFEFDKQFHVSPFLPMNLHYDWRFSFEPDRIRVHMLVMDGGSESFGAGMELTPEPLTPGAMRRMPLAFPMMTARVVAAIYWQAFRLWLKGVRFHPHPDKRVRHT